MAKLVMTIDSDSEVETKVKGKKSTMQQIVSAENEEILLSSDVMLQNDSKALNVGSKQMWKFSEAVVLGKHAQSFADGEEAPTADDERAPFRIPLEEKVHQKLKERGVEIPKHLQIIQKAETVVDEATKATAANEARILHYDKEDLISFHSLYISKVLAKACSELEYEHPTVIQRNVIPAVIEGHDILAHAVTGSGKTAAYLLPILEKYVRLRQTKSISIGKLRYLVMQPTRELAVQCHSMLALLCKHLNGFTSLPVFGGSSLAQQRRELDQVPDFIVATPGRLQDHIQNTKGFTLEDVEILVLDEADRLIEMGFKEDVLRIVKQCTNPKRQTIMVSATLNQDLKELASIALKQPLTFTVHQQQRKADLANLKLTQYLVRLKFEDVKKVPKKKKPAKVPKKKETKDWEGSDFDSEEEYGKEQPDEDSEDYEMDDGKVKDESENDDNASQSDSKRSKESDSKPSSEDDDEPREDMFDKYTIDPFLVRREATLLTLVRRAFHQRVIIFFNEKKQCARAHILFAVFGLKSAEIHGNMTQTERMEAIEKFQRGEVDYLLATDLVARGLDINGVKSVLNFSFPTEPKRYLHRIGRTARAGSSGVAVTLCNDEERKDLKKLSRKLNSHISAYVLQPKIVQQMHNFITNSIDPVLHEIEVELQQDRELLNAYKEAQRAENMIKYKAEIHSRVRAEWHTNRKAKLELQRESYKDLKNIKEKFDSNITSVEGSKSKQSSKNNQRREKKRDGKAQEKKAEVAKGGSKFVADAETDKNANQKKKQGEERSKFQKDGRLDKKQLQKKGNAADEPAHSHFKGNQTQKSWKGKRNSPGAKMAGFRGEKSLKKMKTEAGQSFTRKLPVIKPKRVRED